MALNPGSQATLATLDPNINAPDVVANYSDAFNGRTVLAPQGVAQIGAFEFDYEGDDEINLKCVVPKHWLESNDAVQDHVGVEPFSVTLHGFVSELQLGGTLAALINKALSGLQSSLQSITAYTGDYTPGVVDKMAQAISQAQSIAIQIEQAAARAAQIASFFTAGPALNRQQAAYFQLSSLALARVVFTVATPHQVFDNMVIEELRVVQPKETKVWTDFSVRMVQLNFADDLSLPFFSANFAGRTADGMQPPTQNGSTQGTPAADNAVTGAFS